MPDAERITDLPNNESVWVRYRPWIFAGVATGLCSIAAVVVLAAYLNSETVKAISMRYVGEAPEIRDPKIPLRDDHLPDYKLKVQCDKPGIWIFNGTTYTLGPIPNQSAVDGLEFALAGDIPGDKVQQITLIEDDGISDDPVVRSKHPLTNLLPKATSSKSSKNVRSVSDSNESGKESWAALQ